MTQNDSSDNRTEIGGDSIQTGNISDSQAIAIGSNINQYVTIIQNGQAVRLPLQRPPRAEYFQARQDELTEIIAQLQPGKVATICGSGGMGKSALAAEVLWTLAPADGVPPTFPDGIVFHSFYNQPQAATALENIARSFGEETHGSPQAAAQRALSQRTALLVLDGAEDADDLDAVLAVRNRCGVLITTRNRGDAQGHRLDLEPLAIDDAVTLLREWATGETIADDDAEQIVELVGRLPLAVRLAGRFLAEQSFGAANYATWLADTPLAALEQGERRLESVPLLLTRSMEQVSEQAQETLALIGWLALAPFPSGSIVHALALESPWMAMQALGELVKFGLLQKVDGDAYAVSHALIHTYARKQMGAKLEQREHLVAWMNETVRANQSDFAMLETLRTHVVTLQSRCAENELWDEVDLLAWAIEDYLDLQGIWADRLSIIHTAIDAAKANNNRITGGSWLGNLGNAYASLGEVEKAIGYYEEALAISREIGHKQGEGSDLGNLGNAYADLGEVEKAIGYYEEALAISREIGHKLGEGNRLTNLGHAYLELGDKDKARALWQQSLAIYEMIKSPAAERTRKRLAGLE